MELGIVSFLSQVRRRRTDEMPLQLSPLQGHAFITPQLSNLLCAHRLDRELPGEQNPVTPAFFCKQPSV